MTDAKQINHLLRLGRIDAHGAFHLPVVITGSLHKADLHFDTQESQRFPGHIFVKISEETTGR